MLVSLVCRFLHTENGKSSPNMVSVAEVMKLSHSARRIAIHSSPNKTISEMLVEYPFFGNKAMVSVINVHVYVYHQTTNITFGAMLISHL